MMVLHKGELEAKLKDENQMIRSGILRDENPLDVSEQFNGFLHACRLGDLKSCQEYISKGVNINGKDQFDYTPLIVASLCGHYELVQLLLESGALAERNTFQGERCIYNALNNKIRDLLLSYDFSKSTDPLQEWSAHITSLLRRDVPKTTDITIEGSHPFALHKFLLSSRTPYFGNKLAAAPETEVWRLPSSIPAHSLWLVLRHLYLGEFPRDVADPGGDFSDDEILTGVDKIIKHLEIPHLWTTIMSLNDRRLTRQRHQDEVDRARKQVEAFFRDAVVANRMTVEAAHVDQVKWPRNNSIFADCILASEEPRFDDQGDEVQQHPTLGRSTTSIPVGPSSSSKANEKEDGNGDEPLARQGGKLILYPAHKALLIRSPVFEKMFSGQFKEAQVSDHLHVVNVGCRPEVLEIILSFLYTEKAECPLDLALDLLYAADMLFLDKLKAKAATVISTLGSATTNVLVDRTRVVMQDSNNDGTWPDGGGGSGVSSPPVGVVVREQVEMEPVNIYDVIETAWLLGVQRLEAFAARYLAYRLEDYIDEDDFRRLIRRSAARVRDRQETDTIELLDDIRYYLSERFRLRFEDAGLDEIMEDDGDGEADGMADPAVVATEPLAENVGQKEVDDSAQGNGPGAGNRQGESGAEQAVFRTLDGEIVEDEFDSDAVNYQILLNKIDQMLEELKLDA